MHILYAYLKADKPSFDKYEKELQFSINKSYELYHLFFLLLLDIRRFAEQKIDQAKLKQIPQYEDLHPNARFIDNRVIKIIHQNQAFNSYLNAKKISWVNYPELIKKLYQTIKDSDDYLNYMNNSADSFNNDKKFIETIFEKFVINCEDIYSALEEMSIYWNDDVEFIVSMIIKTVQKFKESQATTAELLPLYKNDDDKDFVKTLFRKVVSKYNENLELIKTYTENWEIDRIAFLDVLLMQMAITEATEFPSIPVKVTLNEYIDIAKFYSTERSGTFINGVLDKIILQLKNEKKVLKRGKGLIGEI